MLKKNKKVLVLFTFTMILLVTLVACGDNEETSSSNENGGGEVSVVDRGSDVYEQSCIACHGGDLEGANAVALNDLSLSKEEIIEILEDGIGGMPGGLADGDEEAVAEYLLSRQ